MLDRAAEEPGPEASVDGALVLRRPDPGGGGVGIENRRLIGTGAALQGQDIAQAPGLLRRLLPVCGWAQGIACRRAIEAATNTAADAASEDAREALLLSEAAVAHLWTISIDWPALQGKLPAPAPIREARVRLGRVIAALWDGADPLEPGTAPVPLENARADMRDLADLIEFCLADVPSDPASFARWMPSSTHPLAALLRRARDLVPGHVAPVGTLPSFAETAEALVSETGFEAAPHLNGKPAELGALHVLPGDAEAACAALGPLAARFAAMLFAMRQTANRLRQPGRDTSLPRALRLPDGWGVGQAETARGGLVHAVRVEHGRIAAFRSVAPTEWLLHPRGALVGCLDRLAATASEADIRLAIAAFDPCAPIAIMPGDPADA